MASLATLVASLKEVANVTANDVISDTLAGTFLTQALAQHNPLYTFSSLPAREEEAVQILAWIKVCLKRASNVVSQQTAHGPAGFGQDRETPYRKNMDMVAQLQRQYQAICSRLGLGGDGSSISVSYLTTMDDRVDALTPLSLEPAIGPLVFSVVQSSSNLSVFDLSWDFPAFDNFDSVQLFMVERTALEIDEPLLQNWNYDSDTGIPRILNGATLLTTITNPAQKAVRITEVDFLKRHHFVAVLKTRSGHYAYSQELYAPGLFENLVDTSNGLPHVTGGAYSAALSAGPLAISFTWVPVADMVLGAGLTMPSTDWAGQQPNGTPLPLGAYFVLLGGGSFSPQPGKYAINLPTCAVIANGDGGTVVSGATNTRLTLPYRGIHSTRALANSSGPGTALFFVQSVVNARVGLLFEDTDNYTDNTDGLYISSLGNYVASIWGLFWANVIYAPGP